MVYASIKSRTRNGHGAVVKPVEKCFCGLAAYRPAGNRKYAVVGFPCQPAGIRLRPHCKIAVHHCRPTVTQQVNRKVYLIYAAQYVENDVKLGRYTLQSRAVVYFVPDTSGYGRGSFCFRISYIIAVNSLTAADDLRNSYASTAQGNPSASDVFR